MRKFFLFLLIPFLAYAVKVPFHRQAKPTALPNVPQVEAPWFTGPLLAPASATVPPGHYNLEPYVYVVANTGRYNKDWKTVETPTFWNNYTQLSAIFGIGKWLDFEFNPTLIYNYTEGVSDWVFGDMVVGFDFQLYATNRKITQWNTFLKLALKETLPFGKYQKLNPKKRGTDVGGGGSWQTGFNIVWGNLFYLGSDRFMNWRTSIEYTLPAPTHVKNRNNYGGGLGTKGTVYPAQNFEIDTAFEINLTRRWTFAIDLVGSWSGTVRFKGKTLIPNTAPASVQFSIAPAIEYNWNTKIGVIFGPWFTVAGRNAIKFIDGVFAINYYH